MTGPLVTVVAERVATSAHGRVLAERPGFRPGQAVVVDARLTEVAAAGFVRAVVDPYLAAGASLVVLYGDREALSLGYGLASVASPAIAERAPRDVVLVSEAWELELLLSHEQHEAFLASEL